jgi:cysteine-rich repeat protein
MMLRTAIILCAGLSLACPAYLPPLPEAMSDRLITLRGVAKRSFPGTAALHPVAGGRLELRGRPEVVYTDDRGAFSFAPLSLVGTTVALALYPAGAAADSLPLSVFEYDLPAGSFGVVDLDLTVRAHGTVKGRLQVPGRARGHGGVLVAVDGVHGGDDLSGPGGDFLIDGVPEGQVRLRFFLEGYRSVPPEGIDAVVVGGRLVELSSVPALVPAVYSEAERSISGAIEFSDPIGSAALSLLAVPSLEGDHQVVIIDSDGAFEAQLNRAQQPHTLLLRGAGIRPVRLQGVLPGSHQLVLHAVSTNGDLDGDGIPDAEDDDRDGDRCPNDSDQLPDDPFACEDLDGDGVGDAMDWDDDGDGICDLEELSPGSDGRVGDPRDPADGEAQRSGAPGTSDDGILQVQIEGRDPPTVAAEQGEHLLAALDAGLAISGDALLYGPYSTGLGVAEQGVLTVLIAGYQGEAEDALVLVTLPPCTLLSCAVLLSEAIASPHPLVCVPGSHGRQRCAAELGVEGPTTALILRLMGSGPPPEGSRCGDGQLDDGEECDDGNTFSGDGCNADCTWGPRPSVAMGADHSCALRGEGLTCWGTNSRGQLGDGTRATRSVPRPIEAAQDVVSLGLGDGFTCALLQDRQVSCWGANDQGQLGSWAVGDQLLPRLVPALTGVEELSVGAAHACAVLGDRSLRCWGSNTFGERGAVLPDPPDAGVPQDAGVSVEAGVGLDGGGQPDPGLDPRWVTPPVHNVAHVSLGAEHTCVSHLDGSVSCWGRGDRGQLGNRQLMDSQVPVVAVAAGGQVAALAVGLQHSCALAVGGSVRCWGGNMHGQLGDGSHQQSLDGVGVVLQASAVQVVSGPLHTCALLDDSSVHCWGAAGDRQLGRLLSVEPPPGSDAGPHPDGGGVPDGGPVPDNDPWPAAVEGLGGVVELGVGSQARHHCARLQDGSVWCWGEGRSFQLGRGYALQTIAATAVDLSGQADGLQSESAIFSCRALRDTRLGALADGLYFLDADGAGGLPPAAAYCDMNTDGGGWTLMVKVNGSLGLDSAFRYHSPLWTNDEPYQPEEAGIRSVLEHKNQAFPYLGFEDVMVGLAEPAEGGGFAEIRTRYATVPAANLSDLFSGGRRGFIGYAAWRTMIPEPPYFRNFRPGSGINAVACLDANVWNTIPTARARLGWIGGGVSNGYCNGAASIIGIGIGGDIEIPRFEFAAGLQATERNQPTVEKPSMGFVFVR